jgi:hypothetical protein
MLAEGKNWPLLHYWRLNLRPTPALCTAARLLLRAEAKSVRRGSSNTTYWEGAHRIEEYLSPLQWLASHGCPVSEEVQLIHAAVSEYPASESRDWTLQMLTRLL